MSAPAVLPALRSPRPIDLADRVGLIEWSHVCDESGTVVGLQCSLKYGVGDDPRKVSIGVALDSTEDLRDVIEQDAIVAALRETLQNPAQDGPMFGYAAGQ